MNACILVFVTSILVLALDRRSVTLLVDIDDGGERADPFVDHVRHPTTSVNVACRYVASKDAVWKHPTFPQHLPKKAPRCVHPPTAPALLRSRRAPEHRRSKPPTLRAWLAGSSGRSNRGVSSADSAVPGRPDDVDGTASGSPRGLIMVVGKSLRPTQSSGLIVAELGGPSCPRDVSITYRFSVRTSVRFTPGVMYTVVSHIRELPPFHRSLPTVLTKLGSAESEFVAAWSEFVN
jgi:hypothetical protein